MTKPASPKSSRKKAVILGVIGLLVLGAAAAFLLQPAGSTYDIGPLSSFKAPGINYKAPKIDTNLLFSDEFAGTSLDTTKWVTCYNSYSAKHDGCTNFGNWEGEWYKSSQVSVAGGNLILDAVKEDTAGGNRQDGDQNYPYKSGMISSGAIDTTSAPKFGHTYGYYEAKVLIPSGQAVWPAFWLLPVGTAWPPEIDIMEVVGQKPNELIQTYFWPGVAGNYPKDSVTYKHGKNLSDDWHVYAIDWQKDSLKWYLDGKVVRQVSSPNVSSTDMHMVLNLAVGGTLPGYPDKTTPTEAQMLVDYVHVYKTRPGPGEVTN